MEDTVSKQGMCLAKWRKHILPGITSNQSYSTGLWKEWSALNEEVSVLPGNAQVIRNDQRRGLYSINKFTYFLESASEMESSEVQSVPNQQVYVLPGKT